MEEPDDLSSSVGASESSVFRAAFELARVGFSIVELVEPEVPETWVIRANNAAASEASQADVSQFVGQHLLIAFPMLRETPFIDWYRQVWRTGEELELPELRYGDDNVPDAAYRVWLQPLPARCVLGQYVNVTLQRRAEGRLRALNASLEQQVERRTAELQASKQMVAEIAYAVAHDLQTPLRHVLMLSELDALDVVAPVVDEAHLEQIHRAAVLMKKRLSALLDYTEAERVEPPTIIDVGAAARDLLADVEEDDLLAGAICSVRVSPDQPLLLAADAYRMVLREYVVNALTFRKADVPPRVSIRIKEEQPGVLLLSVEDNGRGIAPKYHRAVFHAFYRIAGPQDRAGVGVGLARSRVAVTAVGGELGVRSNEGEGATFWARLPIHTSVGPSSA